MNAREAQMAYGAASVCAALSSMVETVIGQKRLVLRDLKATLGGK